MKLFDLTHVFDAAMPVYPGDPVPELTHQAHIETDGFNVLPACPSACMSARTWIVREIGPVHNLYKIFI
jgi:hypothetical protein